MSGRTTWLPRDAAHHDRELVVELGEEFGAIGPYVDTVLRDLAQQQRNDGRVRTGFRSLARKVFGDAETVRAIVARGAEIGLFDDLEVDEDGRRFSLRASGWEADARRGTEAVRKADQRRSKPTPPDPECPTPTGHVPSGRDMSRSVPHTRPEQTNTPPIPPKGEGHVRDDLRGTIYPSTPPSKRQRDRDRAKAEQLAWLRVHIDVLGHLSRSRVEHLAEPGRMDRPATAENIAAFDRQSAVVAA